MPKKVLDILIPTYGRTESVIKAIDSCLKCDDNRFSVLCNSNEPNEEVEKYSIKKDKLYFSHFDYNKGVRRNLSFLIKKSTAKFCLFLSDEDQLLSPKSLIIFLDFLESADPNTSVIYCSIYDLQKNQFFFKPSKFLDFIDIDINIFSSLRVIPTYISGLTFRIDDIDKNKLQYFFNSSIGNAYSHIDLSRKILISKKLEFYRPKFIGKGKELNYGGEAYESFSKNEITNRGLGLNIDVYGEVARARQYFYINKEFIKLRKSMNSISYFKSQLGYLYTFIDATLLSKNNVDSKSDLKNNVKAALSKSIECGEFCNNFFSRLYLFFFSMSRNNIQFLSFILRYINKFFRVSYLFFIFLSKIVNFANWRIK
jgi:hypothetical protein